MLVLSVVIYLGLLNKIKTKKILFFQRDRKFAFGKLIMQFGCKDRIFTVSSGPSGILILKT
jgi:hypothetical protein